MNEEIPAVDEKSGVRDRLDLWSARWRRLHTRAGPVGPAGVDGVTGADVAGADGAATVEFAFLTHGDETTYVALRRAGDSDGTVLVFTPSEWDAFLAGARDGEFDRPEAL